VSSVVGGQSQPYEGGGSRVLSSRRARSNCLFLFRLSACSWCTFVLCLLFFSGLKRLPPTCCSRIFGPTRGSQDRRTNVWVAVQNMALHSAVLSVGWSKGGCSIVSVLASGALHVLRVDEELDAVQAPSGGPPRRRRPLGWTPISDKDPSLSRVFGGNLRCGSVAAGGVSDGSVAVVTVSTADPRRICVWHVFLGRSGNVDVRPLGAVRLAEEDGRCIACLTAPSAGTLFAWSDRGTVSRWYYSRSPAAGRGRGGREGGGGAATGPSNGGSGRVGALVEKRVGSADGNLGPGGHGRGGGTDGGAAGRAGVGSGGGGDSGRPGSGDSAAGRQGGAVTAVADHGKGISDGNPTANGGSGGGVGENGNGSGRPRSGTPNGRDADGPVGRRAKTEVKLTGPDGVANGHIAPGPPSAAGADGQSGSCWLRYMSSEETPPRSHARLYKATAASVTWNGQFVVTVDTARGIRVLDGTSMETVGQSVTAGSMAAEALGKAGGSAGARSPGGTADIASGGGKSSPLTVSVVHPSVEDGDGGDVDEDHAYWGVLLSPSGTVVLALRGDGVVTAWALTAALRDGDLARSYAAANGSAAGGSAEGVFARIRGGWDVLAAVAAGGKARATATAKTLGTSDAAEGLRLGLLGAVDGDTAAVTAARRLLASALIAIQTSAPPGILAILNSGQTGSGAHGGAQLRNSANVAALIAEEVGKGRTPLLALAAAPLADWVLTLCAVWLRRANQMVLRSSPEATNLVGPDWVALDHDDGEIAEATSVVKDSRVTKQLRSAAVACAALTALDSAYGDRGDVRWVRLEAAEAGDMVAALWDVSCAAEQAAERAGRVRALAAALLRHPVAAKALRNHPRLRIEVAERALGLRGSATGAGFLLTRTRAGRLGVEAAALTAADDTAEWCPYDVVTGRPLPPWAPLRRCVTSGLLAAEMTAGGVSGGPAPWAARWEEESPLGGLWARVPSLDLDRYDLLPAVPVVEGAGSGLAVGPRSSVASATPAAARGGGGPPFAGPKLEQKMVGGPPRGPPTPASGPHSQGPPGRSPGQLSQQPSVGGAAYTAAAHNPTPAAQAVMAQSQQLRAHFAQERERLQREFAQQLRDLGQQQQQQLLLLRQKQQRQQQMGQWSAPLQEQEALEQRQRFRVQAMGLKQQQQQQLNHMQNDFHQKQQQLLSRARQVQAQAQAQRASTAAATGGVAGGGHPPTPPVPPPQGGVGSQPSTPMDALSAQQRHQVLLRQQAAAAAAAGLAGPGQHRGGSIDASPGGMLHPPSTQMPSPGGSGLVGVGPEFALNTPTGRGGGAVGGGPMDRAGVLGAGAAPGVPGSRPTGPGVSGVPGGLGTSGPMGTASSTTEPTSTISRGGRGRRGRGGTATGGRKKRSDPMTPTTSAAAAPSQPGTPSAADAAMSADTSAMNSTGVGSAAGVDQVPAKTRKRRRAPAKGGAPPASPATSGVHGSGLPTGSSAPSASAAAAAAAAAATAAAMASGGPQRPANLPRASSVQELGVGVASSAPASSLVQQPGSRMSSGDMAGIRRPSSHPNLGMVQGLADSTPGQLGAQFGRQQQYRTQQEQQQHHQHQQQQQQQQQMQQQQQQQMQQRQQELIQQQQQQQSAQAAGPMTMPPQGTSVSMSQGPQSVQSEMVVGDSAAELPQAGHNGGPLRTPGPLKKVWAGELHVRGQKNDMVVPLVAFAHIIDTRKPLLDGSNWPSRLQCDSTKLKTYCAVWPCLNDKASHWYVRFAPVDSSGNDVPEPKLVDLVKVMVLRRLAFEIHCDVEPRRSGTLYLWGMDLPGCGHSLLGVFRPGQALPPAQ